MIDFYPHSISFKQRGTASFDNNGDPIAASDIWSSPIECRYESEGKSNIQVWKDGSIKTYAFVIYMGYTGVNYDGQMAKLYDNNNNVVGVGLIHHSTPYQLSTVLYIEKCQ